MKKGIIAITLLISGALLLRPVTTTSFAKDTKEESTPVKVETTNKVESLNENIDQIEEIEEKEEVKVPVQEEQVVHKEESVSKEEVKVEETIKPSDEAITDENKEDQEDKGMTKSEAEAFLSQYTSQVEGADFTFTYQGDENTYDLIKANGIRGYVFLPNVETDMAYLVDKDNGSIYSFHPSGYLELLK